MFFYVFTLLPKYIIFISNLMSLLLDFDEYFDEYLIKRQKVFVLLMNEINYYAFICFNLSKFITDTSFMVSLIDSWFFVPTDTSCMVSFIYSWFCSNESTQPDHDMVWNELKKIYLETMKQKILMAQL